VTRFPHPIAWRRLGARVHYAGTLTIEDGLLILAGRESSTGVEASLRIPSYAVRSVRVAAHQEEEVVGVLGFVLELADAVPILIRPVGVGPLHEEELAHVLANALHRDVAARVGS
jgi:hypothetical protein